MLSYKQALEIILSGEDTPGVETVSLDHALGQVAAEKITAAENIPPFHNSAMDGYGVKSASVQNACAENPIILNVDGSTMAGDKPSEGGNGAWEIMTGAPVPDAYDAVIRVEDTTILESNEQDRPTRISVSVDALPGKNIRRAGTDFCPGDILIEKGTEITPHHIMALAALGQVNIAVTTRPKAAVISTGKELVDELDRALQPGQIRNSNAPYLLHSLKSFGSEATNAGTIFDEPEKFQQKITEILSGDTQIILSSGAVSMGRHDFIPDGLREMGAEILFHKAAIRPGKPILFARFPDGTYYFGLPGNPIASAVGLRFFAYPLIRKLRGLAQEKPLNAILQDDFSKESLFRFFQKARCKHDDQGRLVVEILPGQESYRIKPMLAQNCWAVVPEYGMSLKAGSMIDIYPLYPDSNTSDLF